MQKSHIQESRLHIFRSSIVNNDSYSQSSNIRCKYDGIVCTQVFKFGSMASAKSSILQVSSSQSNLSLWLVKGKAMLPQMHIMWTAFRCTIFPWGSITTSRGFLAKFHFLGSLMYLTTIGDTTEGWNTVYHSMLFFRLSNCWYLASVHPSVIGTHTTSYWLSGLVALCRFSKYICWTIMYSFSWTTSRSVMNRITTFLFSTSMSTCISESFQLIGEQSRRHSKHSRSEKRKECEVFKANPLLVIAIIECRLIILVKQNPQRLRVIHVWCLQDATDCVKSFLFFVLLCITQSIM